MPRNEKSVNARRTDTELSRSLLGKSSSAPWAEEQTSAKTLGPGGQTTRGAASKRAGEQTRVWPRVGIMLLLLLGLSFAADRSLRSPAIAQDEESLDDSGGASPATSTKSSATRADAKNSKRNVMSMLWDAGIVWILLFLLISMVAVFFIIEHLITIRKGRLMPEYVLGELEQRIARGEINEAVEFCHLPENYCLATEVVLAGLERYQGSEFGFAEYKTAVEEAGEDQTGRLYRKTEVLGVIGAVAPMLGLTGTVLGMITAFNKIAETGGTAKPEELAGGIGEALVTTLLGLFVAIPTMIAYSYFRNLIDSIVAEAGKRIERVMMPLGRKR